MRQFRSSGYPEASQTLVAMWSLLSSERSGGEVGLALLALRQGLIAPEYPDIPETSYIM